MILDRATRTRDALDRHRAEQVAARLRESWEPLSTFEGVASAVTLSIQKTMRDVYAKAVRDALEQDNALYRYMQHRELVVDGRGPLTLPIRTR